MANKDELDGDVPEGWRPVGGLRRRHRARRRPGALRGAEHRKTRVKWLVFEFDQPLWVVLLVTAAVTLVITELLGATRRRRKRKG